ncbi:hypothetical protein ACFSTC_19735 [Nonomuraea ferruginea]
MALSARRPAQVLRLALVLALTLTARRGAVRSRRARRRLPLRHLLGLGPQPGGGKRRPPRPTPAPR